MTTATSTGAPIGELLRVWRKRRGVSQLDLALSAEVSARHLSFVETGRSAPSKGMVLRLGEHLDVPLRERNQLLLAAGYAPMYGESALADPELGAATAAIRQLLQAHEPYPVVVIDRGWQLVDANSAIATLTDGVAPALMEPPANVLRITLHPDGMAPRIANLGEWRAHLLGRLRREIAATADPAKAELLAELLDYPGAQPEPEADLPGPGRVFVPLRLRTPGNGQELSFLSTVCAFGTPLDITLHELSIEAFFPADIETAEQLRGQR